MPASRFSALAILLGFTVCCPAAVGAQDEVVTGGGKVIHAEARFHERRAGGELDACELTYVVAFEDYIYRRGDWVFLRGAFSLQRINQPLTPPVFVVKVTPFDIVNGEPVLAPIDYAYVSLEGGSLAGMEAASFRCEDGGACLAYQLDNELAARAAMEMSNYISFNRQPGGPDVRVPAKVLSFAPVAAVDYLICVGVLTDQILREAEQ